MPVKSFRPSAEGQLPREVMTPKVTLAEFVSTTAIFHKVTGIHVDQLETEIVKVFPNNVMPANAADWYVPKRKQNALLLRNVLKEFPEKFQVQPDGQVKFLEIYSEKVAAKKLQDLVDLGLVSYFDSKIKRHGVYFFDPLDYEECEPYHSGLKQVAGSWHIQRSKLLPNFFSKHKDRLYFRTQAEYLRTVSREPFEIKINTMGVISKVEGQKGVIKFQNGDKTESAVFNTKSLFADGKRNVKDVMKLPPIKFDAYRLEKMKNEDTDLSWNAVLVWIGEKPHPKFCSTLRDLGTKVEHGSKLDESHLKYGVITSIRPNGAVVSLGPKKRAFIPGWSHRFRNQKGIYLTTFEGVKLGLKDAVSFYPEPKRRMGSFDCVAFNVSVEKKETGAVKGKKITAKNRKQSQSSTKSEDDSGSEPKSHRKKSEKKTGVGAAEHPRRNYKQFLLNAKIEEEEDYDSDSDPSFLGVASFDPELDYDEYSDGDIPEQECEALVKECQEIKTAITEEQEKAALSEGEKKENSALPEEAKKDDRSVADEANKDSSAVQKEANKDTAPIESSKESSDVSKETKMNDQNKEKSAEADKVPEIATEI